jgi:hypothetical protein
VGVVRRDGQAGQSDPSRVRYPQMRGIFSGPWAVGRLKWRSALTLTLFSEVGVALLAVP